MVEDYEQRKVAMLWRSMEGGEDCGGGGAGGGWGGGGEGGE